eukprot:scaffold4503_cov167-Amphora_coffeaeformis.AAC.9
MKLDNSKRMAALKGLLKEEKKKTKEKKDKKDQKKSSVCSTSARSTISKSSEGSVSTEGKSTSATSKTSTTSRGLSRQRKVMSRGRSARGLTEDSLQEEQMSMMNPKSALKLQSSWEHVQQTLSEYEFRVGEELIMAMLELNPNLLRAMGIKSFRSEEFEAACKRLTHHVDYFIHMTGPSVSQELQVLDISSELEHDHIDPAVLAEALPTAMKAILGANSYTPEMQELWGFTFAKHIIRMTRDGDDSAGDFGL